MESKLTVSELKNYLGTGLKMYIDQFGEGEETLEAINSESGEIYTNVDAAEIDLVRPICYRLQDLDKFIDELGFVPIEELNRISGHGLTLYRWGSEDKESLVFDSAMHGYNVMSSFEKVQKLFQWNFWVFDQSYFEKGLIIDKLQVK